MDDARSDGSDTRRRIVAALWIICLIVVIVLAMQHSGKVRENRTAFVRWRAQIHQLMQGENVYAANLEVGQFDDDTEPGPYPNPPMMAILLYPLAAMPPVVGAMIWFALKVAMAGVSLYWSIQLASGPGRQMPLWAIVLAVLLSARMIMSDLSHGNVNIFICFLVVAVLWVFTRNQDSAAGLLLGLATTLKVTPALLVLYFLYKRQWRIAGWTVVGLGLFLLLVPGLFLGQSHNLDMLRAWFDAMIAPYALHGVVETLQVNQSIPGLLHRLLTDSIGIKFADNWAAKVDWVSLAPETVGWIVKVVTIGIILLLAWVCRTPIRSASDRLDWRLPCEYGLVLLAMLFISERSWKHHYVTMILPICAVIASIADPSRPGHSRSFSRFLLGMLVLSMLLMVSTSRGFTGWMAHNGMGHKYALAYNMFMWAGVAVFVALSAILVKSRRTEPLSAERLSPSPGSLN